MSWHPISHNRIIPISLDQEMQATIRLPLASLLLRMHGDSGQDGLAQG